MLAYRANCNADAVSIQLEFIREQSPEIRKPINVVCRGKQAAS